jgi:hypothetical protein
MYVASITEAAMSQGLTPWAASADWSGGATAADAMAGRESPVGVIVSYVEGKTGRRDAFSGWEWEGT